MAHTVSLPEFDKYTKTVIPNDLERLEEHTVNIRKYKCEEDKSKLHAEEYEAKRTLNHLKSNLKALTSKTNFLQQKDIWQAEKKIEPLRNELGRIVEDFQNVCPEPEVKYIPKPIDYTMSDLCIESIEQQGDYTLWQEVIPIRSDELIDTNNNTDTQNDEKNSLDIAKQLREDLIEINLLYQELAQLVTEQREPILRIEEQTEKTKQNISEARETLFQASKLKSMALPVTGAIIGGLIGGPVGAIAGFKGVAILGIGGASLGVATGWGFGKFRTWNAERLRRKQE